MASVFIFNGGTSTGEDEDTLGVPDVSEAHDLERHVERCALRYRLLRREQKQQNKLLRQGLFLLYALIVYSLVSGGHGIIDLIKLVK